MSKRLQLVLCIALSVVLLTAVVLIVLWKVQPRRAIPPKVGRQLTSTLLMPKASQRLSIDNGSVKYDASLKLLSYNVKFYSKTMVISEQPTPDSFSDIPQVYEKLTESMQQYAKFDVNVGTVYLTRPKELNGKQAAVLNAKGTLFFAKPDVGLSQDEWRQFFNSVAVQEE